MYCTNIFQKAMLSELHYSEFNVEKPRFSNKNRLGKGLYLSFSFLTDYS